MVDHRTSRRDLIGFGALAAAGLAAARCAGGTGRKKRPPPGQGAAAGRILFVITGTGGASLMDAFLPVMRQAGTPAELHAFAEGELELAPCGLRCPKDVPYKIGIPVGPAYSQIDFLRRHGPDTAVVTETVTSVNHLVAAQRSLTGNNANRTRTIMEAVAETHGQGCLFPNVNMAIAGYAYQGRDATLPRYAEPISVGDAQLFAFSTHGSQGVAGAPAQALIDRARSVRTRLDGSSSFAQRFGASPLLQRYLADRNGISRIEAAHLIKKLMLIDQTRQGIALTQYGLESSDEIGRLHDAFPGLGVDPLHSQAALAFLLAKYGISTAITFGLPDSILLEGQGADARMESTPLAFDFSHTDHRGTQNAMWRRLLQVADNLITLLKSDDYLGDPAQGKLWSRSLVYVATEFGRTKKAQPNYTHDNGAETTAYQGSGHDMNNGNIIVSPLVKGGRVFGGIDATTGMTYGFDPASGAPDPGRTMNEKHIYSAIAQAVGVDFPGRVEMPAVVRA